MKSGNRNAYLQLLVAMLCIFCIERIHGQSPMDLPKNAVQLSIGMSGDGTDYVWGYAVFSEYNYYFRKRVSVMGHIGATVYDGRSRVSFWNSIGQREYGYVDYTTAGLQAATSIGFSFYRDSKHNLQMGLGLVVRYQTTSNPAILGIGTTFPYDEFYGYEPVSISLGGLGSISYDYTFKKNVFAIAKAALQYDNHDDAFNFFGIGIGRRF